MTTTPKTPWAFHNFGQCSGQVTLASDRGGKTPRILGRFVWLEDGNGWVSHGYTGHVIGSYPTHIEAAEAIYDAWVREVYPNAGRREGGRCAVCGGLNCRSPRCQDSTW